ncbi:MAG TPA: SPOR domain-containing protein [Legionella sp.]|nr:SPOR domain-containing protein [Legionella sp.]
MARDYGSKRTTRHRSSAPQTVLIILVSFLLGYLTASIFDVQTISTWMNKQVIAHNEAQPQTVKKEQPHTQLPPKPKFEFYTLLANEKGPSSNSHAHTNRGATPASNGNPTQTASTHAVTSAINNAHPVVTPSATTASPVKVTEAQPLNPTQPKTTTSNKGSYLIQVASFKTRQDAEHMKGLLILKGFNVTVVPVSQPGGNWFRVIIGPYPNRDLAQKAQVTLARTERLNGMIRNVGG